MNKYCVPVIPVIMCICLLIKPIYAQESIQSNPAQEANPELISLDLKGVDVLDLLKILSVKTGLNIVPTKNVTGRVNLFINNISFDDTLEIVLLSNDLAAERSGNIITVMTAVEYQALYGKKYNERRAITTLKLNYAKPKDILTALESLKSDIGKIIADEASGTIILIDIPEKLDQMQAAVKQLDQPLVTEVFELNYAKAEDVETKVSKVLSSATFVTQVDKRTNKIMVTELPEKMAQIRNMIKEFDEASRQVLIEADIWQLTLTERFERGIDWEQLFESANDLDFQGNFSLGLTSGKQISIGTVKRDKYNLVMQFLDTYGKTDILSRPRIAVVNNEEAKILVGSKEAYITSTISQAESSTTTTEAVNYIDVGVKLNVVPTINKDGFITLKIKPEVSSVRETLTTSAGSQIPIVETSEIETTIKVKDGTTIMIAGLIREKQIESRSEVPVLSKIPFLGFLFSNKRVGPSDTEKPSKTELIICITPRIITGEAGTQVAVQK